eukprot:6555806-Prymnesium_polylepis.1
MAIHVGKCACPVRSAICHCVGRACMPSGKMPKSVAQATHRRMSLTKRADALEPRPRVRRYKNRREIPHRTMVEQNKSNTNTQLISSLAHPQ